MAARPNLSRRTGPARPEGARPVRFRNAPGTRRCAASLTDWRTTSELGRLQRRQAISQRARAQATYPHGHPERWGLRGERSSGQLARGGTGHTRAETARPLPPAAGRRREAPPPPASCAGQLCQAIPNVPIWAAAARRQAGVMPAQIRRYARVLSCGTVVAGRCEGCLSWGPAEARGSGAREHVDPPGWRRLACWFCPGMPACWRTGWI
jgi:hypothetical protein